jgi:hypothetical protein
MAHLDFNVNKVETITLEELKESVHEVSVGSRPLNGIQHFELFDRLGEIMTRRNVEMSLDKIYVASNQSKTLPGTTIIQDRVDKYGPGDHKNFLFRRMLGRVFIEDGSNPEHNYSIAVSFHQDGIQIGMGPNVRICQNLCILGSERMISTYGNEKVDVSKLMDIVDDWMSRRVEYIVKDMRILDKMKEIEVNFKIARAIIGELSILRVFHDNFDSKVPFVLNNSEINRFTEKYLTAVQFNPREPIENHKVISLYDFYNNATDQIKPGKTDLTNLIDTTSQISKYLMGRFNLS